MPTSVAYGESLSCGIASSFKESFSSVASRSVAHNGRGPRKVNWMLDEFYVFQTVRPPLLSYVLRQPVITR